MKKTQEQLTLYVEIAPTERQRQLAKGALAIVNSFETRRRAVLDNEDLSSAGKQKGLASVRATGLSAESAWLGETLKAIDANIGRANRDVERSLTATRDTSESARIIEALRHAEIRRGLEDLDVLEVRSIYFSADRETQIALETGPARFAKDAQGALRLRPWIDDASVAERRLGAAVAANPEAAEALEALQAERDQVIGLSNSIRRGIDEATPPAANDLTSIILSAPTEQAMDRVGR